MAGSTTPLAAFKGLNRESGGAAAGEAHLRQSIRDVLTTPLGSRIMRRDYGSRLLELMDQPLTPDLAAEVVGATAEALQRWEPRIAVERVIVRAASAAGALALDLFVSVRGVAGGAVLLEDVL